MRNRHSIRLKGYDYSQPGGYFVTINLQGRLPLLGEIDQGEMRLSAGGEALQAAWLALPQRYTNMRLDAYCFMPDHMHGIIILEGEDKLRPDKEPWPCTGDPCDRPPCDRPPCDRPPCDRPPCDRPPCPHGTLPGSLGRIIQGYKSISTNIYSRGVREQGWPPFERRLWQRNYFERIIRSQRALHAIQRYIIENPQKLMSKDEA